jgi:hypothetical protein
MKLIIRHCSTCNKNFHSYNYSHEAKGTVEIEVACNDHLDASLIIRHCSMCDKSFHIHGKGKGTIEINQNCRDH